MVVPRQMFTAILKCIQHLRTLVSMAPIMMPQQARRVPAVAMVQGDAMRRPQETRSKGAYLAPKRGSFVAPKKPEIP